MRLIDADALYEQTAQWEARALSVIEKKNRKPFDEMDVNEIVEWRKWSCILDERSAFKHDVFDAPTIDAIPLEWIAGWMGEHQGLEFDGWNLAVGTMVRDWAERKES